MSWRATTAEEDVRIRADKAVAVAMSLLWMLPGMLLSVAFESAVPALVAISLCLIHYAIVSWRISQGRRAHRVAFWAGTVDTLDRNGPPEHSTVIARLTGRQRGGRCSNRRD